MASKSKSQRRLMGYAYSIKKKGKKSKEYKKAPKLVRGVADSMTLAELRDFAETLETTLPETVGDAEGASESLEINEDFEVLRFSEFIKRLS